MVQISFQAIIEANSPQTFQILGKIQNQQVMFLIDKGNTHNFINEVVVTHLRLTMDLRTNLLVMVANEDKIKCMERCLGFVLGIHNCIILLIF